MDIVSEIIGVIGQVLVFTFIPFLVYLIKNKTTKGFFEYIGIKPSTKKTNLLAVAACLIFAAPPLLLTFTSPEFKAIMLDPNSVTGKFRQMDLGVVSITLLLVTAILKTAFAEEIFFRGFVAKRLISAAGFLKGNLIQATLFGLIHAGIFAMTTDNLLFLFIIYLAPAMGAYVSVYLNEKVGNGSITPGWISHSLANVLSYTIVGFVI